MSVKLTVNVNQAYDIACAFVADKETAVNKQIHGNWSTEYELAKDNMRMKIYAPHGAPVWSIADEFWMDKNGSIALYHDGKTVFYAKTRYNVGRAMVRSKYNPISILTRMRALRFFHLIDLCEDRIQNRMQTTDNTNVIQQKLGQINIKQK